MKSKRKYMVIFIAITFGMCWGLAGTYMIFYDTLSKIFGEVSFSNPGVVLSLYSPSIAGIIVYCLMGGKKAIIELVKKVIPKKKYCYWFLIVIGMAVVYATFVHYASIICGFGVPEMTQTPKEMVIGALMNLYEEAGILGGVFGWYGFLLPYLQRKYNNNVKAGAMTGLIFGIFCAPGYVISSFDLAAAFPFYVMQMILFSIFVSYMFNLTEGNLLFYIILFWLVATGSRLELYYFNAQVQILQMVYFAIAAVVIHLIVKKRNIKMKLQVLPEYVGLKYM